MGFEREMLRLACGGEGFVGAAGFLRGALVGGGEEQARAQAGDVVGLAARAEVAEVVADLVGDAERFAVGAEHFLDFLELAGVERAELAARR